MFSGLWVKKVFCFENGLIFPYLFLAKDKSNIVKTDLHPHNRQEELLYDLSYLNEVGQGDQDIIRKILVLFLQQTPALLAELHDARTGNDYAAIKTHAHKMKSSINTLGIGSLKEVIRELETMAMEQGDWHKIDALIAELDRIIPPTLVQLQAFLA